MHRQGTKQEFAMKNLAALLVVMVALSACGKVNSEEEDCAGVPGGPATEDHCGTCDDNPDNDCVQDCAGTWGGAATEDHCGTCDEDPENDCAQDCIGAWGGNAYLDTCGTCIDRDAAPPALLFSDSTDRTMNATCVHYAPPTPLLLEEAAADVRAESTASSSAYVYFLDDADEAVGEIHIVATNYETLRQTEVFETPIAVFGLSICSWWNPATLLQLDLYGDSGACTP